ncbi:hypothetical protein P9112_000578 [Eukaryota sp. TZLM1-RC]
MHSISLLIAGDASTGKTSILHTFLNGEFPTSSVATIGVNYLTRNVTINDSSISLKLYDSSGQDRYRSLTMSSFRQVQSVVFVFDVTSRASFESLQTWITDAMNYCPEDFIGVIVGNKTDLQQHRQVETIQAEKFAEQFNMAYIETSAKKNQRISEVFETIASQYLENGVFDNTPESNVELSSTRTRCGC